MAETDNPPARPAGHKSGAPNNWSAPRERHPIAWAAALPRAAQHSRLQGLIEALTDTTHAPQVCPRLLGNEECPHYRSMSFRRLVKDAILRENEPAPLPYADWAKASWQPPLPR